LVSCHQRRGTGRDRGHRAAPAGTTIAGKRYTRHNMHPCPGALDEQSRQAERAGKLPAHGRPEHPHLEPSSPRTHPTGIRSERRQCARCSRRGLITKRGRERPGFGLLNICCRPMVISPRPRDTERQVPALSRSRSGDSWRRSRRRIREIRDDEHDRARAKRSDQEAAANGRRAG
jgi:hypothetical protein